MWGGTLAPQHGYGGRAGVHYGHAHVCGPGLGCSWAGLLPTMSHPLGLVPWSWHPVHSTPGAAHALPAPCPTRASSLSGGQRGSKAQRESPAGAWRFPGATSPRCDISPHCDAVWRQARHTQLALKSPTNYSGGAHGVNHQRTSRMDAAEALATSLPALGGPQPPFPIHRMGSQERGQRKGFHVLTQS